MPVPKDVEGADIGGSDRALAVFGATRLMPAGRPGLVVSCGTAITVERVTAEGVWQGGAIAPGLGQTAPGLAPPDGAAPLDRARRRHTAGLGPRHRRTRSRPASSGGSSARSASCSPARSPTSAGDPWVVWTGGDAELLAPPIFGANAQIEPNLILVALAEVAFGESRVGPSD